MKVKRSEKLAEYTTIRRKLTDSQLIKVGTFTQGEVDECKLQVNRIKNPISSIIISSMFILVGVFIYLVILTHLNEFVDLIQTNSSYVALALSTIVVLAIAFSDVVNRYKDLKFLADNRLTSKDLTSIIGGAEVEK